jgi:hypothetical protein
MESALQSSSLFGTSPRRFFEIQPDGLTSHLLPKITYLITFQEVPSTRVTVSSLTCSFASEVKVSQAEIDRFYEMKRK